MNAQRKGEANPHYKHGLAGTRIYRIWSLMKDRCINTKAPTYHRYGGRGISVCNEWLNDFQSFYEWAMENGYREDLTIDRIDNDGNYSPENCRWVDMREQANNRKSSVIVAFRGEEKTFTEWARAFGINDETLRSRIKKGVDFETALTTPVQKNKRNKRSNSYGR